MKLKNLCTKEETQITVVYSDGDRFLSIGDRFIYQDTIYRVNGYSFQIKDKNKRTIESEVILYIRKDV